MNYFRTALLLAAMTAIFVGIGYFIGGEGGMLIAFAVALAMNFFSYWNSDSMVLSMYGAEEVDERSAPQYYAIVRDLTARAGLPMPRVYVINSDQPNAFATGRDPEHAAVAASTGLLTMLTPEEVAGVMAHELAHVKHRDTLIMTITATIAGAIGMLANFAAFAGSGHREEGEQRSPLAPIIGLVMMILAPIAAMLVQMAISRGREYEADREGAIISGQPLALASALAKIENYAHAIANPQAEANPATAHLFIINPLSGAGVDNLFSTHPNTQNRIAALQQLASEMGSGYAPAPRRGAPGAMSAGSVPRSGGRRSGIWNR